MLDIDCVLAYCARLLYCINAVDIEPNFPFCTNKLAKNVIYSFLN